MSAIPAAQPKTPPGSGGSAGRRVLVLVDGPAMPRWCDHTIAELRRAGASVDVVAQPCPCAPAATGTVARLTGALAEATPLLRNAPIALTSAPATEHDVVLDLRRCAPHAASESSWYLRLGDGGGAAPYLHAIGAGERTVTVELRALAGGGERLLARARYRVQHGYGATIAAALRDGARLPARALELDASGGPVIAAAPRPLPRAADLWRFGVANVRVLAGVLLEYFFLEAVWNVGELDATPADLVAGAVPRVRWWPEFGGNRAFVADPIVARHPDGRRAMLVEAFDPVRGRGIISAVPLDGSSPPRDAIVRDEHLSYPYVLEYDGELYCIPENHESGGIPVYRCTSFPDGWEFERVMTPAPDVLDPTIFEYAGRWWLFGTRRSADPNAHLFAWYGDGPFGPWTPHAANPILTDASAARPAGPLFRAGGECYRPAQDSSRSYGGALAIARIDTLTPERYDETVVRRLPPLAGAYGRGIHTLCIDGERAFVDGKRYAFSLSKPVRVLAARARRR